MKLLAIVSCFALLAGAFAQQEDAEEGTVVEIPEAPACSQVLIDLYRNSRNACIDEIRAERALSTSESTTESTTSTTEDIEEDLERCANDEDEEDDDDTTPNTEGQGSNRAQQSGRNRHQGRRARGRHALWSARRKEFFYRFKTCLVDKIKDDPTVVELKTTCVANCANVSAAKRDIKEKKCILKKLKKRCPGIVPERRPRTHRRLRLRTRNNQRRNN